MSAEPASESLPSIDREDRAADASGRRARCGCPVLDFRLYRCGRCAAARESFAAGCGADRGGRRAASTLTIVYGSQTGNSRRIAESLAREAESAGVAVRLLRADAYPLRELAAERLLYVVISTQGEGDPPDDARGFIDFLASRRAPKLAQLKYAVLGLGDSSYPQFCAIGNRIDARLAELGASRLFARGEADLDIDAVAAPWAETALPPPRARFWKSIAASGESHAVACADRGAVLASRQTVRGACARQPAHHRAREQQGRAPCRALAGRLGPPLRAGRFARRLGIESAGARRCGHRIDRRDARAAHRGRWRGTAVDRLARQTSAR